MDNDHKRVRALQLTEAGEIWGIGRQLRKRLNLIGGQTALDFTQLEQDWVRKNFTIVGERIWKELHGEPCIEMEAEPSLKKQICVSRSFGEMITDIDQLSAAVTTYASLCAEKLRKQKSCAVSLLVFIHTNYFRVDLPQYASNRVLNLQGSRGNICSAV